MATKKKSKSAPASTTALRDGAQCEVVAGTHAGKSGTVRDIKTGKTGHVSITVVQANGERFKTLAKSVVIKKNAP
jgi:ribosomal protein S4E